MSSTSEGSLKQEISHHEGQNDAHRHQGCQKVKVSGNGDELITLGNKKYYRHELMVAFGGTMQAEAYAPYPKLHVGNPAPFGLLGFAMSNIVLGLFLAGSGGIKVPNVVVGLCIFYGGFTEVAAGIWEMFLGNTFAATTFISYGTGFWMVYGALMIPAFGIETAYAEEPEQLASAIGFFCMGWALFSTMLLICTLKSTIMFIMVFLTIAISFYLSAGYYFTGNIHLLNVAGVFTVICGFCGLYCAVAGLLNPQNSYFTLDPISVSVLNRSHPVYA